MTLDITFFSDPHVSPAERLEARCMYVSATQLHWCVINEVAQTKKHKLILSMDSFLMVRWYVPLNRMLVERLACYSGMMHLHWMGHMLSLVVSPQYEWFSTCSQKEWSTSCSVCTKTNATCMMWPGWNIKQWLGLNNNNVISALYRRCDTQSRV